MTNLINYIIIGLRAKAPEPRQFKQIKQKGENMTNSKSKQKTTKTVVAIVHAGHGTSYASGTEQPIIIATRAAKEAKSTWESVYKFPKETIFTANVYDITGVEKWNYDADSCRLTDAEEKVNCNFLSRYQIVL